MSWGLSGEGMKKQGRGVILTESVVSLPLT